MKIQRKLEKGTLTHALGYSFVNPSLATNYGKEYNFLEDRNSVIIRNGYDVDDFKLTPQNVKNKNDSKFKIGIIGTVYSQGNAPQTLLQAISLLKQKNRSVSSKLRVIFLGKWTREFISYLREIDCFDQIELREYLPHKEALDFANSMDSLALALHSNLAGSNYVTPGRIYEYLYLKKPILAMCPLNSDLAHLIKQCNAGEVIDYFDVEGISEVLDKWLSRMDSITSSYSFKSLDQFDRRILTKNMMDHVSKYLKMSE
jgi:glycosyltransferase involved in cell wall biosynthesis